MAGNKPFVSIGAGIAFCINFGAVPTGGAAKENAVTQSMDERFKLVDAYQERKSEGGKRGKGHPGEREYVEAGHGRAIATKRGATAVNAGRARPQSEGSLSGNRCTGKPLPLLCNGSTKCREI